MDIPVETPDSDGYERKEDSLPDNEVLKGEAASEIERKYGVDIARYAKPSRGLSNVSNGGVEEIYNQYFEEHVHPYIEELNSRKFSKDISEEAELIAYTLKGLFNDSKEEALVFLNSKIYFGSKSPSPIERLKSAYKRGKLDNFVELLKQTIIAYDQGAHF